MIRYFITRHARLDGVGLSRLGDWGNIRHPDAEAAERAAREDAGKDVYSIEREVAK